MRQLGGRAQTRALALLADYRAGTIDADTLRELVAGMIATVNAQGVLLGETVLAGYLETATGQPVTIAPADAAHFTDTERLAGAVATCLASDTDELVDTRLGRLAHSEPIDATQHGYAEAMRSRPDLVRGWTRELDSSACQLCQWWRRGGQVWPLGHAMPTHKGDCCTQRPVMR